MSRNNNLNHQNKTNHWLIGPNDFLFLFIYSLNLEIHDFSSLYKIIQSFVSGDLSHNIVNITQLQTKTDFHYKMTFVAPGTGTITESIKKSVNGPVELRE